MRLIRINCHNLMRFNRNSLNMDTIATIIKNASLSLIYYAGNTWMNQITKPDAVRTEYHKSIRMLTPNIKQLSISALNNFNGFPYFDSLHHYLNTKTYSKILRLNTNNEVTQFIQPMKKEWREWNEKKTNNV